MEIYNKAFIDRFDEITAELSKIEQLKKDDKQIRAIDGLMIDFKSLLNELDKR
jgi:hypothetical protein